MEKLGSMMGNKDMENKGYEKRAERGFGQGDGY